MPASRRLTLLQTALLVSLFAHAIGIFAWGLQGPVFASTDDEPLRAWTVDLVAYRERGPVTSPGSVRVAGAPRPQAAAPPRGYVGRVRLPQPVAGDAPKQQPRRRTGPILHDVPAPPPPVRSGVEVSRPTPAVSASSDPPPDPATDPQPTPVAQATPAPPFGARATGCEPTPIARRLGFDAPPAARPSGAPFAAPPDAAASETSAAPPAPAPAASGSPALPGLVQDPQADFSLILSYHNDERLRRDASGAIEFDIVRISALEDVKPVLAQDARAALPLREAGRFGLHPMDRVKATVRVAVDLQQPLPQLVAPAKVEVVELTLDGRELLEAQRTQIAGFIREGVAGTKWFPASSKGVWSEHSEQTFEVEIIQASDTAMSPPTSRAP